MLNLSTTKKTKTWRNRLSIILFSLSVAFLSACGNPQDDEAVLTLYLGGGSGKVSVSAALDCWPPDDADLYLLTYDVLLTGPAGQEIQKHDIPGDTGKINFEKLTPGTWDIRIEAYTEDQLYAYSFAIRTLVTGKNNVFMMMQRADDYKIVITVVPPAEEVAKGFSYVFSANTFAGSKLGSVDIARHSSYIWSVDGHKSSGTYITSGGSKGADGSTGGNLNVGHLTVGPDETATKLTIKAESVSSVKKDDEIYGTATVKVVDIANAAEPVILVQPKGGSYGQNMYANELKAEVYSPDGGVIFFKWYSSTDKINWSPVPDIVGGSDDYYRPSTVVLGTTYYYVEIRNINYNVNGNTTAKTVSDVASVTVSALVNAAAPSIRVHPADASYTLNATANELTVEAVSLDGGTLSYQWYKAVDNVSEGILITGATNPYYKPDTSVPVTIWYYVEVTNTNSGANINGDTAAVIRSNKAEVNVAKVNAQMPVITLQPIPADYALNSSVTALNVNAAVTDGGVLSYQWYKSSTDNVSGGTAISGAITPAYIPVITSPGTFYYFVIITNTNTGLNINGDTTATFTSDVVKVTVEDARHYTVTTEPEWTTAINTIKGGGNNENYVINIANAFGVAGIQWNSPTDNTFGTATGIKVTIRGESALTLNSTGGCFLAIGRDQTVIMQDLDIVGVTNNGFQLIMVNDSGASFTMLGSASVYGNTVTSGDGGGVNVCSGGTFTMKDNAKVYNNEALCGGGVTVFGGTFIMEDNASVYNNKSIYTGGSSGCGGGVYVQPIVGSETLPGNFIMNGGSVHDNEGMLGGGVYVEGGIFTMANNASVYNNKANSYGGGVFLQSKIVGGGGTLGGQFLMNGGSVSDNTANNGGGGVYVHDDSKFKMSDGEISGNTASGGSAHGGGVYLANDSFPAEFTMTGGTISGNSASGSGGGVYGVYGGTIFTKTGGIIYGRDIVEEILKNKDGYGYNGAVSIHDGSNWVDINNTLWANIPYPTVP